ncbi:MAG: hypothetical protein V8Q27_10240 [Eubacteriales bacterium]
MGRNFYAVGGNREAARASGINLRKYTILAYLVAGAFTNVPVHNAPELTRELRQERRAMRARELQRRLLVVSVSREVLAMRGERLSVRL